MSLMLWLMLVPACADDVGQKPDNAELIERLLPDITQAKAALTKVDAKSKRILVTTQWDSRMPADPDRDEILDYLRKTLPEVLQRVDREPVASKPAEDWLARKKRGGSILTSDLTKLREFAEFDALLNVTYLRRDDEPRLRLTLLAANKVVWQRIVKADETEDPATPRVADAKKKTTSGGPKKDQRQARAGGGRSGSS